MKKSVLFSALLIAFMASAVFAQAPALPELADDHTMFCVTPLYENISNSTYLTGYTLFQKSHSDYDRAKDLCVSYWSIPDTYDETSAEVYFTVDENGDSKTYYDTWTFLYAQLTGGFKQIRVQGTLDFGDATDYTDPDVTCKSFEENNLAFQGKSFDVNEGGGFSGDANSSIQHICYVGNETSISFVNVVSTKCSGAQNLTFDNVYFKSTNSGSGSVGILSNNDMLPLSFIRVFNSRFEGSTVGAIVGNTSKSVSDIRVENVVVAATGGSGFDVYAGGVAGYLGGDSKNDTLVNVQVVEKNSVSAADVYGSYQGGEMYVGGLAGFGEMSEMNGLLMENVTVSVDGKAQSADDDMGTGSGGEMYVGGAVGELFIGSNDVNVYNVSAKDVSVNVKGDAIGYSFDDYDYSGRAYVGGFLGNLRGEATGSEFKNITGEKIIVSVAAKNTGFDNKVAVGGFAGSCETGFSANAVELIESQVENKARSKNNYVGGLVGYSSYSSYSSDYTFDKMELDVDVSQSNTTDGDTAYVGGIFGLYYVEGVENTIDRIQNSELKGDVSSSCADELYIGGAIGKLDFAEHGGGVSKGNIEISKFAFVGDVKHGDCSGYTYAGGLLGEIDGNGLYPSAGSSASMGVTLQNTYTIGDIQTAGTGGSSVGYLVGAILQPDESQFGIGDYTFNLVVNGNYHYGENDLSVSSPFDRSSCELITGWLEDETSFDKVDLCSGYAAYSFSGTFNQGLVMTYRNGTSSAENIFNLALSDQLNSSDMKTDMFAALLNTLPGDGINSAWSRKDDVNNGLPIFADEKNDINAIYRLTFNVTSYCPTCDDNNEKKTLLEGTLGDDFIVEASGQGTVLAYTANTYQGNLSTENFEKITSVNDKGVWFGSSSGGANVVLSKHGKVPAPLQLEPNPFLDEYPVFYYVNEYDGNGQLVSTTEIDGNSMVRFAGPVIRTYQMDDENTLVPSMFEMDYNNDNEVFYQLENVFLTQGDEASGTYNEYSAGDTVTHFSSIRAFLSNAKSYGYDIDAVRIYYKKLEEQKLHFATVHNRDANMPLYLDADAYVYGLDDITGVYSLGNAVNPTENTLFPITPSLSFDPTFGYDVKGFDVDFAIVGYDDATDVCQGKTPFDIEEEQTYETLTGDEFVEEKISSAMRDTYLNCKSTVWHFELGAEDSLHLDEFLKSYLSEEVDKNIQIYVTPKYNFVEYAIDFVRPTSEQFFVFSDYLGENWLESVSYTKENEDALILDARRFVTTYGNASGWAENKNAAQIDWAHNLSHLENIFTPTETEKTFYPVSCEFTSLTDKSCLESDDVVVGNYAFTLKTDGNGSVELWQILGADNATTGAKADTIRHQFTAVAGAENTFEMLVPKLKDDAGGNDYMPFVFEIHAIPADDYAGGTYKLSYSVDGGAYESLKNGDIFAETEPENLVFDVSFKKPQINRAMFTFKAVDGTEQVFYGDDRVDDGEIFDYLEASGKTEFEKIVYTSGKCLAGWAVAENPVDGESLYNFFDENLGVALKAAYPEAKTSEYTLYARWTDDLSKCAAGANAFTRISHEGEHGMVALGISDGANTVVHEFTSSNTMLVPTGLDVSLITFEEMPESGYALDSIAVKIGSQTVVRMPTDKLPNNYADAILRSYFSKVNLEARFAFVMGSKKDSVLYGDDWKKDFGVFNSVDEKKLPTMLYTVGECLEGWSVQNAQGEKYDIFDKQMGLKLEELNPDAHNSYSLYANWTDDLSMCAAGADAFTRVSYKSKHGAVTLQDTVTNMVYAFAPNRTMVLPSNTNGAAMKAFVDVEPGYALDSLVVKFDNKSIALKPGDNLPKNILNATIWAYFSEDLKIPVEFVSPKVQLSGNALRFAFSTTEFRIDGQALVSILLENEKGWKARQKFDVKTVPYNESWKKFYLPSGDYVLTAKLINGADTVEFKKDSIVVESEIKSAGPDGWQMVSLYSVEMNEYRHDDDAVFYWWDESSSAGDFWHYKELGFTPVKRGVGYWYNSIEGRGLKLRDASDKDSVLASSAYWDLDSVYSGWNLVANPNGFKIDVSTSPDYYDEMEFLRWNTEAGEYEPVKVLDPYEAVWVKVNDKSRFALPDLPLFAEDGGNALQKSSEARTLAKASGKDNWTLQVVLADNNGKRDSYNMIGVGKKCLSVEEPPEGMGEHVALSFVEGKKSLAKSVKAPADEVEWTMELKANSNRMGSLSLDGVGKLNAMGLKVFVTVDGKTTEISEGQKLNVALSGKSKFATVRVAEKARVTVAGQLDGFKAVKVGSGLQVSFNANQDLAGARARVDLVDMKGHVVASAAATTLAGANSVTLTAPKPGLYMVRVRAGSQMGAGKVVVK